MLKHGKSSPTLLDKTCHVLSLWCFFFFFFFPCNEMQCKVLFFGSIFIMQKIKLWFNVLRLGVVQYAMLYAPLLS